MSAKVARRAREAGGAACQSISDALAWAIPQLAGAQVLSPRLDAEVLLANVLSWRRSSLYARPEHGLTPAQARLFADFIVRRAQHEPVPYITGRREFFALDFAVDHRVLIPRPETELVVERALAVASSRPAVGPWYLADIGTGSGIIGISIAVNCPRAVVFATDISSGALRMAQENARHHGVGDRVHFLCGDLLEPLVQPAHMIVANLPYVPSGTIPTLARDVVEYEPLVALDGGHDGLAQIERLLSRVRHYLVPHGIVIVEIGAEQGEAVCELANYHNPGADVALYPDYASLPRVVQVRL